MARKVGQWEEEEVARAKKSGEEERPARQKEEDVGVTEPTVHCKQPLRNNGALDLRVSRLPAFPPPTGSVMLLRNKPLNFDLRKSCNDLESSQTQYSVCTSAKFSVSTINEPGLDTMVPMENFAILPKLRIIIITIITIIIIIIIIIIIMIIIILL
ncbi:hypothetical protein STEG23_014200 [Scotinomys teguina]